MIEPQNIPWSEKYRPKKFKDIQGQELAINKIKDFLHNLYKVQNKKQSIKHNNEHSNYQPYSFF